MGAPGASIYRRRRAIAVVALGAVVFAATLLVLHGCSGNARRLAPAEANSGSHYDPLAYDDSRRAEFETRATAGLAHVLYAKSPGGAFASARRTTRWRPLIERAARAAGIDPDMVEGIVMLESAGRPDVIAGPDAADAAGLSQILAGTATDLLGMHVDLAKSRSLTKRITTAAALGKSRAAAKLRARRRRIDDRFNPPRAIAGTVRYLALARKHYGRDDLAVASYHMGIGNLDNVLRRFTGAAASEPIAKVVSDDDLSYTRVYFESTPLWHPSAYSLLSSFGDDSSTYLWRVLAAREILRLYRQQPQQLRTLQALQDASDSAERVLHPGSVGPGPLVQPPSSTAPLGLALALPPGRLRALRAPALATLIYIGVGTNHIAGQRSALTVTAATVPGAGLPGSGWEFDVARNYRDHRQALAFQFMLDRLQALNVIAWRRDGDRIRVVVSSDAARLLPSPAKLITDAKPAKGV